MCVSPAIAGALRQGRDLSSAEGGRSELSIVLCHTPVEYIELGAETHTRRLGEERGFFFFPEVLWGVVCFRWFFLPEKERGSCFLSAHNLFCIPFLLLPGLSLSHSLNSAQQRCRSGASPLPSQCLVPRVQEPSSRRRGRRGGRRRARRDPRLSRCSRAGRLRAPCAGAGRLELGSRWVCNARARACRGEPGWQLPPQHGVTPLPTPTRSTRRREAGRAGEEKPPPTPLLAGKETSAHRRLRPAGRPMQQRCAPAEAGRRR